ncbi:hypothetical protein ED236_08940 [Pseudomethylobacillus aquaticus]|uniref:Preprotein translocase subunit YajC n=1 Tax=Pseudomethylobacillus aquaticus TaxID=2676064 RepID=A0A3N0V015_9PROT|nr:PP0621 family protein [Pseudomethylobacillus aquaticus]ROH85851.1 hypothetical protein ED236_08940 [Pseudomethylobacillus aquaticus]
MFKLIIIAFAIWLLYRIVRGYHHSIQPPAPAQAERMVQCAHCGTHIPESESLQQAGIHYCSRAHLPDHDQ